MLLVEEMFSAYDNGMMMLGDWEAIHRYSSNPAVKVKVELGTANGLTTILLARGGGVTWTFDRGTDRALVAYLRRFHARAVRDDTVRAARRFEDESVDLLFIDGGHSFTQVTKDYRAWRRKMKPGSVILFHDMDPTHPGVWRFYKEQIPVEVERGRLKELSRETLFRSIVRAFECL